MRTTLTVLSAVLVAQLVLAAALNWGGSDAAELTYGPLFNFDTEAVDAIHITDADGDTLKIKQTEGGWTLPAADGFPANAAMVERLLTNAHSFSGRLPVARSHASRLRFSVAADKFERRIQFMVDGEPRATLLLGDSAGPGRVYARAADQNMIYEVDFSLQYAAADVDDWLDHSVVAVDEDKVQKVIFPGFTLLRAENGEGWKIDRGGDKGPVKARQSEIDRWLGQLTQPDFDGVAKAEPPQGEPKLTYTLVTKKGNKIRFAYYGQNAKGENPHLYRSDQPWSYRISEVHLAKLTELDGKQFVANDQEGGKKDKQTGNKGKSAGSQSNAETGQDETASAKKTAHSGK